MKRSNMARIDYKARFMRSIEKIEQKSLQNATEVVYKKDDNCRVCKKSLINNGQELCHCD